MPFGIVISLIFIVSLATRSRRGIEGYSLLTKWEYFLNVCISLSMQSQALLLAFRLMWYEYMFFHKVGIFLNYSFMLVFVQSMCNPCVLSQPASMCWTVLDHTFTQPVTQVLLTVVHSCAACVTASVSLYLHYGSPDLWYTQVFSSFFLSIITSSSNSTLSLLSLCHHAVS